MPNQNTYFDDKTQRKAIRALTKDGAMDVETALDTIDRLDEAGIILREPMRKEELPLQTR